jgi:HD-GYP domain-containing protein (c-di-GMP phosphodiesterase class II)
MQQLYSLVEFVERKELFTLGHAKNVSKLSVLLGNAIGFSVDELDSLRIASFLHDIGKSGIPASLLTKPEKLSGEEMTIIRTHPVQGARLVSITAGFEGLAPFIKHHHEKYDGTGYPDGLKGDEIPLLSRIICIADAFDSMVRRRAYSIARSSLEAIDEICRCSGTQFDPALADTLVAISDSVI